ncbi:MAG: hypothetical protein HGN29_02270 [Asgard group archaeon]|nr:hypothetical protein [Asgard group archaeon]
MKFRAKSNNKKYLKSIIIFLLVFSVLRSSDFVVADLSTSIVINSDDDFVTYGFPGNGTQTNPYIMENIIINESADYGIYVKSTTMHFIIRNCSISGCPSVGILIESTASGTVILENNTCYENGYGIFVSGSNSINIRGNNCSYNGDSGIRIDYSSNIIVEQNLCDGNRDSFYNAGIRIGMSAYAKVLHNNCSGNDRGIEILSGDSLILKHNNLESNPIIALYIGTCPYSTVSNNYLKGASLSFVDSPYSEYVNNTLVSSKFVFSPMNVNLMGTYTFANNTVNSKPFVVYHKQDNITLDQEYGQVMIFTCTNIFLEGIIDYYLDFSKSDTITIANCSISEGLTIYTSKNCLISNCEFTSKKKLRVEYTDDCIIENCYFKPGTNGLLVGMGDRIKIRNNVFNSTSGAAIYVETLKQSYIDNNICINSATGIFVRAISSRLKIRNNICSNNSIGIRLSYNAEYCTIFDNTCNFNSETGIYVWGDNNIVENNTCKWNTDHGIYYDSKDGKIQGNKLSYNSKNGLTIISSRQTSILGNIIRNNLINGAYIRSSYACTFSYNIISNNNNNGLMLKNSDRISIIENEMNNNLVDGIYLNDSYDCTFSNNIISNNSENGIVLKNTNSSLFTRNLLEENNQFGIAIDANSRKNIIFFNNFTNNNLQGNSQAQDNGTQNFWYDSSTKKGNYWSDWIGERGYFIAGSAKSFDLYPVLDFAPEDATEVPTEVPTDVSSAPIALYYLLLFSIIFVINRFRRKNRCFCS